MTMPSIADVKAAAAVQLPLLGDRKGDIDVARLVAAHERLARFALSVLNAPGLSAERLEEIQRKEQAATEGPWEAEYSENDKATGIWRDIGNVISPAIYVCVDGTLKAELDMTAGRGDDQNQANLAFITDREAVPELLAEVLRLRAGVTLPREGTVE